MQMGRKGRNGQHAVAAGCCILGESAKCPAHHLHTALRHRSDQPRIQWCRMGRKERSSHHATAVGYCILGEREKCSSRHLHTTLRHPSDQPRILWCRWAARKKTVIMPSRRAAAFSAKEGMSFTPPSHRSEAPIRSAKDLLVQNGPERKKRSSCRRGGLPHSQRRRECLVHHLRTDLRHRSDQPRIFWCRWAGRKETVIMPSRWAAAFSAKERNVRHTNFTPR